MSAARSWCNVQLCHQFKQNIPSEHVASRKPPDTAHCPLLNVSAAARRYQKVPLAALMAFLSLTRGCRERLKRNSPNKHRVRSPGALAKRVLSSVSGGQCGCVPSPGGVCTGPRQLSRSPSDTKRLLSQQTSPWTARSRCLRQSARVKQLTSRLPFETVHEYPQLN